MTPNDPGPVIDDTMPAAIAAIDRPASFVWIGGRDGTSSVAGAFRTDAEPSAALAAAVAGLSSEGWEVNSSARMVNAFESPILERSETLCRNGESMSIAARRVGGVNYLSYGIRKSSEGSICQNPGPNGFGMPGGIPGGDGTQPDFDFRAIDPAASERGFSSGGSGSGSSSRRTRGLRIDSSLTGLADGLGQQLIAQGWSPDARWTGSRTAGSTWSRRTDDDRNLSGALDVIERGESVFNVVFTTITLR
jgi:hypothetical protein